MNRSCTGGNNGPELIRSALRFIKSLLISFSCVILTYVCISRFSPDNFGDLNNETVMQLFMTCAAVAATQFLIGLLQLSFAANAVLFFIDMFAVVFGLGHFAFHFFENAPMNYLLIPAMLVVVYGITFFLSYHSDYKAVQEINAIIRKSGGVCNLPPEKSNLP